MWTGTTGGQVRLDPVTKHIPDLLHLCFGILYTCNRAVPGHTHQDVSAVRIGKGNDFFFEICVDLLLQFQNRAFLSRSSSADKPYSFASAIRLEVDGSETPE